MTYPFKRPKLVGPPPKKKQRQGPEVTETGTCLTTCSNTKYSTAVNSFTQNSYASKFPLVNASNSSTTWHSHQSALTCFKSFCSSKGIQEIWPIPSDTVNKFCQWALDERKLKSTTVKAYMSSLALYHKLNCLDDSNCSNYIAKLIIRGAENVEGRSKCSVRPRNAVTLSTLKVLGHEISQSFWHQVSKQIFWTASCLAFFGSLRMGELLAKTENSYDPDITLLWKDVRIQEDSLLIHIKSPKSRTKGGEFVDIFPFHGHNCCPVKAFIFLKKVTEDFRQENEPIFKFKNNKLLTKEVFNKTLGNLLDNKLNGKFSGHSFRAGIPTSLAKYPDLANSSHIMGWGRWSSSAYLSYTKLKTDQKRCIFKKIVNVLNI